MGATFLKLPLFFVFFLRSRKVFVADTSVKSLGSHHRNKSLAVPPSTAVEVSIALFFMDVGTP